MKQFYDKFKRRLYPRKNSKTPVEKIILAKEPSSQLVEVPPKQKPKPKKPSRTLSRPYDWIP